MLWHNSIERFFTLFLFAFFHHIYIYIYIQWGEINVRTNENFYFLCFKHSLNKIFIYVLWPRKGSLMKTQTWIFDNRLYYTRKIELQGKGKKSCTFRITSILISSSGSKISQY